MGNTGFVRRPSDDLNRLPSYFSACACCLPLKMEDIKGAHNEEADLISQLNDCINRADELLGTRGPRQHDTDCSNVSSSSRLIKGNVDALAGMMSASEAKAAGQETLIVAQTRDKSLGENTSMTDASPEISQHAKTDSSPPLGGTVSHAVRTVAASAVFKPAPRCRCTPAPPPPPLSSLCSRTTGRKRVFLHTPRWSTAARQMQPLCARSRPWRVLPVPCLECCSAASPFPSTPWLSASQGNDTMCIKMDSSKSDVAGGVIEVIEVRTTRVFVRAMPPRRSTAIRHSGSLCSPPDRFDRGSREEATAR
jgi:hypothetical protein